MLRLKKDDDLFKSSTMSFGEHLEELRGALFRSLAGIAIGLAISFPFADNAVRFVEGPLMRGLEKHYRQAATDRLLAGTNGTATITDLQLVQEQQLLPRQVYIERAQLERSSGTGSESRVRDPSVMVRYLDIELDETAAVARTLIETGRSEDRSLAREIWQSIPASRQPRLVALAGAEPTTEDSLRRLRRELASALDDCLDSPSLMQAADAKKTFHALNSVQRHLAESIQATLQGHPPTDSTDQRRLTRQLNRMLLVGAFPDAIRLPQPDLVPLTLWETSHARIQTLGVPEAFMAWVKAWLVLTVLVSSPWIFYQIWMFVASGLYGHERQLVYTFLPFSLALFLAGAALAFVFVFDPVLDFLFEFNRRLQIDIEPRFNDWMGFVLLLPLGFGVAFQLPLVMLAVERLGMVTVRSYISRWRFAVLGIFVMSMLLTPADPISMLLMAIPLTFLYFGGILLCHVVPRPSVTS